jgi:hypothetical protein
MRIPLFEVATRVQVKTKSQYFKTRRGADKASAIVNDANKSFTTFIHQNYFLRLQVRREKSYRHPYPAGAGLRS